MSAKSESIGCTFFLGFGNSLTLLPTRFIMVLSFADIFFQNHFVSCCCFLFVCVFFSKKSFGNISMVSNSLDPDQAGRFVGPDLGPNCLQM